MLSTGIPREQYLLSKPGGGISYAFNPYYGYTEFGKENEIICTGFINRKMPLIRYCLDDAAVPFYDLYKIEGHRTQEVLIGKNGECFSAAAINFHTDAMKDVIAYQFVQDRIGFADMNIVLNKEDGASKAQVERAVNNKIGVGLQVKVNVVDNVLLSSRGKQKLIIQKMDLDKLNLKESGS